MKQPASSKFLPDSHGWLPAVSVARSNPVGTGNLLRARTGIQQAHHDAVDVPVVVGLETVVVLDLCNLDGCDLCARLYRLDEWARSRTNDRLKRGLSGRP